MATMTFGVESGVSAALKSGPTSGEVLAFLNGTGPACLFVAKYMPTEDSDSPREGEESKAAAQAPVLTPVIVAHTGLMGYAHSTAGMAEVGRLCYFIRQATNRTSQSRFDCQSSFVFTSQRLFLFPCLESRKRNVDIHFYYFSSSK